MNFIKKTALAILAIFMLSIVAGYLYFEQKFTPEKNYLTVTNESGKIPILWLGADKNVMLVPVKLPGTAANYYMQFDTGSAYTIFYSESIKRIGVEINEERAKASIFIGNTKITSDKFKIINNRNAKSEEDSVKVIGTLGADILENKRTIINLKENHIVFNVSKEPRNFQHRLKDFRFKKRKIILQVVFNGKTEKFLYDSGASAYELLTTKEIWDDLKLPNSKVTVERVQSWQNVLTAYTAKCHNSIQFGDKQLRLSEVTYVKGFSEMQYMMMKFSGMTGMLGNKIFLHSCIYIDGIENKIGVE